MTFSCTLVDEIQMNPFLFSFQKDVTSDARRPARFDVKVPLLYADLDVDGKYCWTLHQKLVIQRICTS